MDIGSNLTIEHRAALTWFADRAGQEISWPEPLDGLFLANKAKGIHKPKFFEHALSVRQSLNGPYEDALHWSQGRWQLDYAQEGSDSGYFTNQALRQCLKDEVPLGVLVQTSPKPKPRYTVLGLGQVVDEKDGVFRICQYGSGPQQIESALDVSVPASTFDATNLDDARSKTMRAISTRRGQPAFRKMLLAAYDESCAVSGCTVKAILEAAHILPYRGVHTNHVTNGVLLRADLHTLFDLGLLSIDPESYAVQLSPHLSDTEYAQYDGMPLRLPLESTSWPDKQALKSRPILVST